VHKETLEIFDLLSGCNLYNKTLTGEEAAKDILEVLEDDVGADLQNWRVNIMADCCATNGKSMDVIKQKARVSPLGASCVPHGINNAGKKMEAPHARKVLKRLTKIVQFGTCKARVMFLTEFKEQPKKGGSVNASLQHLKSRHGLSSHFLFLVIAYCRFVGS
jgi:hypothetical protein